MKKIIFSLFILFSIKSNAQNPTLNDVNGQLRQMFTNLDKPTNHKKFLYDMAAHVSNDVFFDDYCTTANTNDDFFAVYNEMYHTAYDTTPLIHPDNLFLSANNFPSNIIPIGIMNYSYYKFVNDALTTNQYFDFDTINDILTDKYPRPTAYPFSEHSMFMAAPLMSVTNCANPTFRIDPQFIFFDQFNAANFNNPRYALRIDFGDGNGWVTFNPHIVTNHQVTYTTTSNKIIRIGIFDTMEGTGVLTVNSQSRFLTPSLVPLPIPTETFDLPGINASWFPSCTSNGRLRGRTVIYVEGIDILDVIRSENRDGPRIYSEMISGTSSPDGVNDLVQLRNEGYDFLVVDWKNSRIDMRFNALYLVNLIQWLKQQKNDNEQFVIIGESMGGVISRYALTYMETDMFRSNNIDLFFQEAGDINNIEYLATHREVYNINRDWNWDRNLDDMHQTRLFISLDAPHQGANVPISIQKAYRHTMNIFGSYIGSKIKFLSQAFNLFLDGQAAQQLLIYHIDKENGLGFYKTYDHTDEFQSLRDQMKAMGNYPQFAKVVLMSNGSLNGRNQTNFFTNQPRQANDRLIDFHASLYARILWFIKVPIFGGDLTALTNPDGQGPTFKANLGTYSIRIRLKWFGIKISSSYSSIFGVDDYAETRPYCTSAGSYFASGIQLVARQGTQVGYNLSDKWLFNLFSYNYENDGHGCIDFTSHVGLNGFASVNADYSLCTDGALFGFVPTASALDYGDLQTLPLNYNIDVNDDINTKLGNVDRRVDVLVGIAESRGDINPTLYNQNHLHFRNDRIHNFLNRPDPSGNNFDTYFSCLESANRDVIKRGFLNLEIGDEQLYLENNTLNWNATYQSEYDIHINERNPYYEYPSQPLNLNPDVLAGIYSREADFIISNTGFANFIYDTRNGTSQAFYPNNLIGSFSRTDRILENCCRNYAVARKANNYLVTNEKNTNKSTLQVYPNPSNGNKITLNYSFIKMGNTQIELFNLQGQKVYSNTFFIPSNIEAATTTIDLSNLNLNSGVYIIKMLNGKEILNSKLIIAK